MPGSNSLEAARETDTAPTPDYDVPGQGVSSVSAAEDKLAFCVRDNAGRHKKA